VRLIAVVILGDPGTGKTTLLRYLALPHARALLDDDEVTFGVSSEQLAFRGPSAPAFLGVTTDPLGRAERVCGCSAA